MKRTYDFAVIGAGVFGAWIARFLHQAGCRVALVDAYGPANGRASSGGETRVIRMGYGPDELYTSWAKRSLPLWEELELQLGAELLHRTGVLWLSNDGDEYTIRTLGGLRRQSIACERLDAAALRERYPELKFEGVTWGLLEPHSGVLMARKSVQLLTFELDKSGVNVISAAAIPPTGGGNVSEVKTTSNQSISASQFVFACGPWLPKIFPDLLGERIFPSRQEVFFLGTPAGSDSFRPPKMPVWLCHQHADIPYSIPDIEGRGFKIAFDRHGPAIDPDTAERVIEQDSIARLREFLARHIPTLKDAPVLETRVCQYENTWNGDFLVDRHPGFDNVWLVGGGSGHGFKHGPAMGEYFSRLVIDNAQAEPRFSLESKQASQSRAIY
jgi:monomeric sarcosine oxidase